MHIKAKQEFTITLTGEELLKLKSYLASGYQYHTNTAYDFEHDEKFDKEYNDNLVKQHRVCADAIMEFAKALPTPF